jgi:hypothetical protein
MPEVLSQHHDALGFPDGSTVLVNLLVKGQRLHVLQMPVTDLRSKTTKEKTAAIQGQTT